MTDPNDLRARFGSARRPGRAPARHRPPDVPDDVVEALGKLSEALEVAEQARGALYEFHRLSGTTDLTVQEAVRAFRSAGLADFAAELDDVVVGRDVIADRWTFELVDEYDRGYWQVLRAAEARARQLVGVVDDHVYEAGMKVAEQRDGTA